jgi:hypothetical protein
VILSGLIVSVGPFPGSVLNDPERFRVTSLRVVGRAAVALACVALARTHWSDAAPCSFAFRDVFVPTDALRSVAAEIITSSPILDDARPNLIVLARRPMAFYLALQGRIPFRLAAGENAVTEAPRGEHDWAFVDTSQLGDPTVDFAVTRRIERRWLRVGAWTETLDPVTRLDVCPGSAYELFEPDPVRLYLMHPRRLPGPFIPSDSIRDVGTP